MGGDDRPAADAVQLVEDRPAERGPLGRVGAGAELVDQDERPLGRLAQQDPVIRRMCDEKVERDCSRLCSSPMSASTSSRTGSCDPWLRRDVQAALGHHREQADGLQRHRLAAGVRPGDDQQVELEAEVHVDRRDLSGRGSPASIGTLGAASGAAVLADPGRRVRPARSARGDAARPDVPRGRPSSLAAGSSGSVGTGIGSSGSGAASSAIERRRPADRRLEEAAVEVRSGAMPGAGCRRASRGSRGTSAGERRRGRSRADGGLMEADGEGGGGVAAARSGRRGRSARDRAPRDSASSAWAASRASASARSRAASSRKRCSRIGCRAPRSRTRPSVFRSGGVIR